MIQRLVARCSSLLFGGSLVVACTGTVGTSDDLGPLGPVGPPSSGAGGGTSMSTGGGLGAGGEGGPGALPALPGEVYFQTGVKRLTRRELRKTVVDLTGIDLGVEVN